MAGKNVTHIYVSPLRRTLITCMKIFDAYDPKPKFTAIPEIIEKQSKISSAGSDVEKLQKEFPLVDFSLLLEYPKPHFWYIYQL